MAFIYIKYAYLSRMALIMTSKDDRTPCIIRMKKMSKKISILGVLMGPHFAYVFEKYAKFGNLS